MKNTTTDKMNQNPIEELRRMETPVTEEEWTSIVNDRRYVRKFGRKGLSPKGRAALIAGAVAVLITVPILVKTLTKNEKETAQAVVPATETVTPTDVTPTDVPAHTKTTVATTSGAAKHERGTLSAVTAARSKTTTPTLSTPGTQNPATTATTTATTTKAQTKAEPTISDINTNHKDTPAKTASATNRNVNTKTTNITRTEKQTPNKAVTTTDDEVTVTKSEPEQVEPATEAEQFFIPTAFTPNGDGLNDLFLVQANFEPRSFEMTVLNRGGDALFQTRDMSIGWDGQQHGKVLPHGVYICIIKYKDSQGNEHKQQGQVLLIP